MKTPSPHATEMLGSAGFDFVILDAEQAPLGAHAGRRHAVHHARRLVLNAEQIVAEMAEHARGVRGFVRMLAKLGAIVQFLPEDLQSFMAAHRAIRVDLE